MKKANIFGYTIILLCMILLIGCTNHHGPAQETVPDIQIEEKNISLSDLSLLQEGEIEPASRQETDTPSETPGPVQHDTPPTGSSNINTESPSAESPTEGALTDELFYLDADCYGQNLWLLTTQGVVQMNLETEATALFSPEKAELISVNAYGICLLTQDSLKQEYFNGDIIREISLECPQDATFAAFDAGTTYAVYALRESGNDTDRLYCVELGSGRISEIAFPWKDLYTHLTIRTITCGEDDTFYFTAAPDLSVYDAYGQSRLYSLNAKSGRAEEIGLYRTSTVISTDYDPANRLLYLIGTEAGSVKAYNLKNGEETTASLYDPQKVTTMGFEHNAIVSRVFYTGSNFILWSKEDKNIQIVKADSSIESLRILCSEHAASVYSISALIREYRGKTVTIQLTTFSDSEYDDKLRMKLLAGDDDFDIFLMTQNREDAWLWDVLRNGAFEPLDGYACFAENQKEMFKSLQNMMTDLNGRTYGIPLSFNNMYSVAGCTEEFMKNGLDYPAEGWAVDDFFALCEQVKAKKKENPDLYICSDSFLNTLILTAVQKSVYDGAIHEEDIRSIFANIGQYAADGLFYEETEVKEHYLLRTATLIPNRVKNTSADIAEYRSFPTVGGMTVEYLAGCALINPKSTHKQDAASFLAFITSPEILYGQDSAYSNYIADCFFYPGYDNYKNFDIKEMYPISDRQKEMFDHLDDIPVNMRALTISPSAIGSRDFIKNLIKGSMSASDASDQVLKTVKYRYFE